MPDTLTNVAPLDHRDLAPERHRRLLDRLKQQGYARVSELCAALDVSSATVRRDLAELEQAGQLRRVHGGAVSSEAHPDEPPFDDKTSIAPDEKRRIADAAYALIEANDTIYLDGGSTVLLLAHRLRDRSDITVVTNSLRAGTELSGRGPKLIMIGGELRRRSQTMVGPLTRHILEAIRVRKAFMGTMGATLADGLTTTDQDEAFTKTLITAKAEQVILLADSGKIGKTSFAKSGNIDDIDIFVTDSGLDKATAEELRNRSIRVITV